jgi:hypothetical protein
MESHSQDAHGESGIQFVIYHLFRQPPDHSGELQASRNNAVA